MSDFEYDALLDRARDRIPTDISERNRWTMPNPEILVEGNQTIIRNFSAIVDAMDRDANNRQAMKYKTLKQCGVPDTGWSSTGVCWL